ncbi:hypothetical protein [Thiohalobacter thiocyanaticus]|nr:hypothetical protein [Thiohalobacter thiocyanaticus]
MSEPAYKDFACRLQDSLIEQGIVSKADQEDAVARAAEVTKRTARRYLSGLNRPQYFDPLSGMADVCKVMPMWLYSGEGPRTKREEEFYWQLLKMPPDDRMALHRALTLLPVKTANTAYQ